jgi:hypothetical protein
MPTPAVKVTRCRRQLEWRRFILRQCRLALWRAKTELSLWRWSSTTAALTVQILKSLCSRPTLLLKPNTNKGFVG